jgi:hypothetical protein
LLRYCTLARHRHRRAIISGPSGSISRSPNRVAREHDASRDSRRRHGGQSGTPAPIGDFGLRPFVYAPVALSQKAMGDGSHGSELLIFSIRGRAHFDLQQVASTMAKDPGTLEAPPAETEPLCSASARGMRRHRVRRKNRLRCVMVELREREIDALIRRAGLPPDTGLTTPRYERPYTASSITTCGDAKRWR